MVSEEASLAARCWICGYGERVIQEERDTRRAMCWRWTSRQTRKHKEVKRKGLSQDEY